MTEEDEPRPPADDAFFVRTPNCTWRSIATAPDGEWLLLGGVVDGNWHRAVGRLQAGEWEFQGAGFKPSFWMPLEGSGDLSKPDIGG